MEEKNLESNFKKSILLTLITFTLIIFVSFIIIEKFFLDNEFKKEILNSFSTTIVKEDNNLIKLIDDTKNSLVDISHLKSFKEAIKNRDFNELETIFFTISQANPYFMQLRYVDKNGKELIRVDRVENSDTPLVIKFDKLQDKSSRDYFIESKNKKDFYISNLDLNIENGQIEFPFNPTLRVILPILNNNSFDGELIVNIKINLLFESPLFDLMICDSNGKVILPFDKTNKEFDSNLNYYFPKDYSNIVVNKKNIYKNYFSYRLDANIKNSAILVLKLKDEYISKFQKDQMEFRILVFGIFFLMLVAILYVVFKKMNRLFYFHYKSKMEDKIEFSNKEFDSANNLLSKSIDLELILSQSSTSMILTNNKIEILFVNKAFLDLFGYSEDEVLGKDPGFLRNEDIEQNGINKLRESLKDSKSITVVLRNYTKGNELKYIELSISPIFKENSDKIIYYLGIQKDVTKEQNILKELKRIF